MNSKKLFVFGVLCSFMVNCLGADFVLAAQDEHPFLRAPAVFSDSNRHPVTGYYRNDLEMWQEMKEIDIGLDEAYILWYLINNKSIPMAWIHLAKLTDQLISGNFVKISPSGPANLEIPQERETVVLNIFEDKMREFKNLPAINNEAEFEKIIAEQIAKEETRQAKEIAGMSAEEIRKNLENTNFEFSQLEAVKILGKLIVDERIKLAKEKEKIKKNIFSSHWLRDRYQEEFGQELKAGNITAVLSLLVNAGVLKSSRLNITLMGREQNDKQNVGYYFPEVLADEKDELVRILKNKGDRALKIASYFPAEEVMKARADGSVQRFKENVKDDKITLDFLRLWQGNSQYFSKKHMFDIRQVISDSKGKYDYYNDSNNITKFLNYLCSAEVGIFVSAKISNKWQYKLNPFLQKKDIKDLKKIIDEKVKSSNVVFYGFAGAVSYLNLPGPGVGLVSFDHLAANIGLAVPLALAGGILLYKLRPLLQKNFIDRKTNNLSGLGRPAERILEGTSSLVTSL